MYRIKFYRSRDGKKPVLEYLRGLTKKNDKDSRIKANKIRDYIKTLSHYGTAIGEPYIKKLDGDIWELRPLQDRILFAAWVGKSFLLISHFVKKTQKTPRGEIEKAKRLLDEYRERSGNEDGKQL
ncbi:MAG: type II toxin-antitoxin system RelE/ParE family toxin [Selenomonadaceae bacterium]|nr:type II toxin-antitoxin system RelE/ParE family toxin [Selenomonadaceae bacterium]